MTKEGGDIVLSSTDWARWSISAVLLLLGVLGFYYFADQALLYRVLGIVAMFSLAAWVALGSEQGVQFRGFMRDARVEVRKMIWPTRGETLQTSLVVFVAVIIMAIFLWLLDRLLSWAITLFLGG